MTQKHPQRCETCKHFQEMGADHDIFGLKLCKKHDLIIEPIFRNQIKYTGCATHSSAGESVSYSTEIINRMCAVEHHIGYIEGATETRKQVLQEQGLECWGHYQINSKRCLKCSIAEMCYTKRECDTERAQRGES